MSAVQYANYRRQRDEHMRTLEILCDRIHSGDYTDHRELSGIASSVHTVRRQLAWLDERLS